MGSNSTGPNIPQADLQGVNSMSSPTWYSLTASSRLTRLYKAHLNRTGGLSFSLKLNTSAPSLIASIRSTRTIK